MHPSKQNCSGLTIFEAGNLGVREFCERKRVSQNTFYQWRRKLKRFDSECHTELFVPVAIATEDQV